MANGNMNKKKPRIKLNSDIKQIYMTGAMGGFTPHDFRLFIFNEKPEMKNSDVVELVRNVDHELIMSFQAVKELYTWLDKRIKEFENEVGEIKPNKPQKDVNNQ